MKQKSHVHLAARIFAFGVLFYGLPHAMVSQIRAGALGIFDGQSDVGNWSPDGKTIFFTRPGGGFKIYSIPVEGDA